LIEIQITGNTANWYRSRGYEIPTKTVQLWAMRQGRRIKAGTRRRVENGTRIHVRIEDLAPNSNALVPFTCDGCGNIFHTQWRGQRLKSTNNCVRCQAGKSFKGGCHSYWVDRLIASAESPRCDISGESDKRFLELHHLLSRSIGGVDAEENYAILSANYHRAFHNWMGGSNVPTRPEDYERFKALEPQRLK
jgi:hypothetical protein